ADEAAAAKSVEETRHLAHLRYVTARMQGDMDIVDPLIDDYLTRLAGSPDPVEAEMRRYADERDGFPIVGQTVGTLLAQCAPVASSSPTACSGAAPWPAAKAMRRPPGCANTLG